MPAVDHSTCTGRDTRSSETRAGRARELTALELGVYMSLEGIAEAAGEIVAAARADDDVLGAARAELVRSDAIGRSGELENALALQQSIAVAAHRERAVRARAGFVLASTFFRLGMWAEAQDAVHDGVRLLDDSCPPHWGAEHHMALALYTSYDRAGPTDWELFEDALRRARLGDQPNLLLAVLNKFVWASQSDPLMQDRADELVDELEVLLERGPVRPPAAMLDTIAWIRVSQGRIDDADRLLERALASPQTEPNDDAALLAHLATVRHRQGRLGEATQFLETARVVALRARTPTLAVEALRHLAAIDADRGDFRRAYRRLSRFLTEQSDVGRAEAEHQATILQSVYGRQAERDQRLYYQELAMRDPLTRLFNRRHVERELPLLLRDGQVAVAMIDVDRFKQINDEHSHETGDKILVQLGALLQQHASTMAPDGFCARLGGEEFLLAAPVTTPPAAAASLEQLRERVATHRWSAVPASLHPTISAGLVVALDPGLEASAVIARADHLLYLAKRSGRNRVETAALGDRPRPSD
ncbi:MAG TPA: diguanylate cyclase [Solirubrobacteraceae bacterium]|nr:diguanylate cyclase [Solirubrobacteraceae bacterium]